jgi:hypothetical protein
MNAIEYEVSSLIERFGVKRLLETIAFFMRDDSPPDEEKESSK